jgi:hypothetical protein
MSSREALLLSNQLEMICKLIPHLIFLAYQIVIDFIDLFPFNNIHSRDKRLRKSV